MKLYKPKYEGQFDTISVTEWFRTPSGAVRHATEEFSSLPRSPGTAYALVIEEKQVGFWEWLFN